MEKYKDDINYFKNLVKEQNKSIKQMAFELNQYRRFVVKLDSLKNKRLMELEGLGDTYPFKHYKIRKDEVKSSFYLVKKNVPKFKSTTN